MSSTEPSAQHAWSVGVAKSARKQLDKLPARDFARIDAAIESMRVDPFQGNVVHLTNAEAACRHPVKDRMDITGARWSLAGAEAVLQLRALRASGDFDGYWRFHEDQEYQRNHVARYTDAEVPAVEKPGRTRRQGHLRIVK